MSRYDEWAVHLDPAMPDGVLDDDDYEALDRISEVLGDEAVWDGPPPALRDRLLAEARAEIGDRPAAVSGAAPVVEIEPVATEQPTADDDRAITAEQALAELEAVGEADQPAAGEHLTGLDAVVEDDPNVISIDSRSANGTSSPARLKARARWLVPAMTAAAAAIAIIAFVGWPRSNPTTYEVAGTELTPNAAATVEVEPLPAGVAITLHITGLPPAGDGEYYAGWLSGDEGAVSIGSFHWRMGGIPIELWSGVDVERYPNLGITLQQEGEPTVSSGVLVLTGRLIDE